MCEGRVAREIEAFNVAASIKMRKFDCAVYATAALEILQCGRIYKDAEILKRCLCLLHLNVSFNVAASIKMRKSAFLFCYHAARLHGLQCGRIYKDAEISLCAAVSQGLRRSLQCGRIYKDAEISA